MFCVDLGAFLLAPLYIALSSEPGIRPKRETANDRASQLLVVTLARRCN